MGQTIKNLSSRQVSKKTVFNNRFVVEVCEKMHTHFRNLRIVQSLDDWIEMAEGFKDALERWKKKGEPQCGKRTHIELCRKQVAVGSDEDMVKVNLNRNLYPHYEGKIFSDGADIDDDEYIHLKIRDLRLELTKDEFKQIAEAIEEANGRLRVHESSGTNTVLQKT